jgi:hypothetical protein
MLHYLDIFTIQDSFQGNARAELLRIAQTVAISGYCLEKSKANNSYVDLLL